MEILKLQLYTANLEAQKRFYCEQMGFYLAEEGASSFTVNVGYSQLIFEKTSKDTPFYHFAFNIPENQFSQAKEWLATKTRIIDEVFFDHWNAHAVYFHDAAENIVELIARHDLENSSQTDFSASSVLNISEVGIPVDDVLQSSSYLQQNLDLPVWYGSPQYLSRKTTEATAEMPLFSTLGDQHGLFVIVCKGRGWFPTRIASQIFPMSIFIRGNINKSCSLQVYSIKQNRIDGYL